MANFEKTTVVEKVSNYVENRRKIFLSILSVVIVLIVAYVTVVSINSKAIEKGLSLIDSVSYVLTKDSKDLSDEELEVRRNNALNDLSVYLNKTGIVGVRANMLAGEISYSKNDFANSAKYWMNAAAKGKNKYTAPLAYFNAGVSYENIKDFDNAEKCYNYAVENKDFLMSAHAEFSLGRVRESKGDKEGAVKAYKSLNDKSPDSSWGKLAKSRLIAIVTE